jgi:ABC-2 type transport system ATP-binding protein
MSIIKLQNINRSFSVYKKSQGLLASLKNFFIPRVVTNVDAVKNVSFSIEEGEMVGFVGPNGAGKTTTLKILSGIIHPTSGDVNVLGYVPHERNPEFQKQFGIILGQKNQLIRTLPPVDSFIQLKAIYGISDEEYKESLDELVNVFDIGDYLETPVRKLSLGQRMKCELVASLLHRPKVLLLDEPTIGLDVVAQKSIREFIKKYNKKNKTTIILTSHYMDDIKELCERVIMINHGTVVYDGKLSVLIEKYAPYKLIKITSTEYFDETKLKEYGELYSFDQFVAVFKVGRFEAKKIAAKLIESNLPIDDILIDEVSIDDVIRQIFQTNGQV